MASRPTTSSSASDIRAWLEPGFTYLENLVWPQGREGDRVEPPSWDTCREDFLKEVEVRAEELEQQPELRVLLLFAWHVTNEISSESDRWELLLDESKRNDRLDLYLEQWKKEAAAAAPAAAPAVQSAPEDTYVEGRGWMRYDGTEWVLIEPEPAPDATDVTDAAGITEAAEAEPLTEEAAVEEAGDVTGKVMEEIVVEALQKLLASRPGVSREQFETVIGEVLVTEVTAAGQQ